MRVPLCFVGAALAANLCAPSAKAQNTSTQYLPAIDVTYSRLAGGIAGASTTIITEEEIARSPSESLQNIIEREAGVQTTSVFGAVNGAGTTLDLRGFGAAAASNTVVLIDGRRLTDIDQAGVDFSAIPRDSIARIEITRGNSGAVLYGDGSVGGVINIVTKTGVGRPLSARIDGAIGSFGHVEGNLSASGSTGPFAASVFANVVGADGYRENNRLLQRNAVGDFRYTGPEGSAYLNLSADDQRLGLPGVRRVTPFVNELVTDPRGATTPTAFANKQGLNATAGVTRTFTPGLDLILDGGVRHKEQQTFSSLFGFDVSDARQLTTASLTPRVVADMPLGSAVHSKTIAGIDFYNSDLTVDRGMRLSDPAIHRYDLTQRSLGAYGQETFTFWRDTDLAFGARVQNTGVTARDAFNPGAPGASAFDTQATPLDSNDTQAAWHLGAEHRFNEIFALFGRLGHSFRSPNVDERIGVIAFPIDFNLKTQTSNDMELGGRIHYGRFDLQSSVYRMDLTNEIMFIPFPALGANTNLDPTRRFGVENTASLRVLPTVRLKGSLTYTEAKFRAGPNAGNDVPLVSRWTGSAGVSWDAYEKWVVFDAVVRYVGARRMDNDQTNFQPLIPAHTLVDLRVGGEFDRFFWSLSVQNLFDVRYFDYAVASATTFGTYNAYPMPGRTFLARLGIAL
jgi:iron complex outermembrane receptor protein